MELKKILKFWTWFKEEPVSEEEKPVEEKFSTDLGRILAMKKGQLRLWILSNMFQKTPNDFKPIDASGNTVDGKSVTTMDASTLKSAFSLSSGSVPQVLLAWYITQGFIGFQACAIIAQQWLVDKACTVPAKDAIKNGYKITVNDGTQIDAEILSKIEKADKRLKVNKNLVEFGRMARVFGIRIALFEVDSTDDDYYVKPFNPDGITEGSYKGIAQVDPYWITPELDADATANPSSTNFYEPTWWRISGKRYHRSHLIITRNAEVPDVLKPTYIYGGLPLPQLIYERVYAAERTANEAPMLALTKRVNVVKTDMEAALANQKAFEERMATLNTLRDNHGIFAIDEDDEFEQTDTSLTDLDALIMTQYQLVAAIAGMPSTKLLGTSPKGFNATGEHELASYYDLLEGIQVDNTELLDRHYMLLIRSEIAPKEPFEITVNWNPLKSPTDKDISDINFQNSQSDLNLANAGAIDGDDIRGRIIADPNSGYSGIAEYEEPDDSEEEKSSESGTTSEPEEGGSIQEVSMNGAQVTSLVDVISKVATGELPRASGIEIIKTAFPVSTEQAEKIIGDVGSINE